MRDPIPDPIDELRARYRAALAPTELQNDESRMWFEAGRAAAAPRVGRERLLMAYSGVSTAVAATLAALLAWPTPAVEPAEPVVVEAPAPAPVEVIATEPSRPPAPAVPEWLKPWLGVDRPRSSRLVLREPVLTEGVDAMPDASRNLTPTAAADLPPSRPATIRQLLEEYLPPSARQPAPAPPFGAPEADLDEPRSERLA